MMSIRLSIPLFVRLFMRHIWKSNCHIDLKFPVHSQVPKMKKPIYLVTP
uniref:Uncharacterized protein n=1 Tax=Anguilla anguilla TaxID=7936 RepID=A0A0E9RMK1_ANGAN